MVCGFGGRASEPFAAASLISKLESSTAQRSSNTSSVSTLPAVLDAATSLDAGPSPAPRPDERAEVTAGCWPLAKRSSSCQRIASYSSTLATSWLEALLLLSWVVTSSRWFEVAVSAVRSAVCTPSRQGSWQYNESMHRGKCREIDHNLGNRSLVARGQRRTRPRDSEQSLGTHLGSGHGSGKCGQRPDESSLVHADNRACGHSVCGIGCPLCDRICR